jgi:hypothetical protein
MVVTELPMIREPVKPVEPNAPIPIVFTESGMMREPVNLEQVANADIPIVFTEFPILREPSNPEQDEKA